MILAAQKSWRPKRAATIYAAWMLVYLTYCIAQRFFGLDWSRGFSSELGGHRFAYGVYRVSGFMSHPLTLAFNLVTILLGCLGLAQMEADSSPGIDLKKFLRNSWFWSALASVMILLVSGSRFPVALAVIFLTVGVLKQSGALRRLQHWVILAIGFLSVALTLVVEGSLIGRFKEVIDSGKPITESFTRWTFWKVHWDIFLRHPLFGTGLHAAERVRKETYLAGGITSEHYAAHNMIFQSLADSGLLGLLGLLAFFWGFALATKRAGRGAGEQRWLWLLFASCVGASLLQNTLRDSEYLFCLWLFSSFLFAQSAAKAAKITH